MYSSEISRPMTPTTSRIVPTVEIEMPDTVAVTAKRRIAPSAIRKIDVPIPMVSPHIVRLHDGGTTNDRVPNTTLIPQPGEF
jgi:hypothetical protein